MKSLKSSLLVLVIASLFFMSCEKENLCIHGEGPIVSQNLNIPDFNSIDVEGSFEVFISQGAVQEVHARGHANIIERLKTNVYDHHWDMALQRNCYRDYELTIYITVPQIENIELSGSGIVVVNDFDLQNDLSLDISGSGDIELGRFEGTERLSVDISGSGNITTKANFPDLRNLDIDISGSGEFNGFSAQTDHCHIDISGSGNCRVFVRERLEVDISGSGNIFYKGNPTIYTDIDGSGDIINAN